MTRLNDKISLKDMVFLMSDENEGAKEAIRKMLGCTPKTGFKNLIYLDQMDVYGIKLEILWKKCTRNPKKLEETLQSFKDRMFSKKEILEIIYSK